MKILDIAKQSLTTLWTNKYLWFFGFFVASVGGSGSSEEQGHASYHATMAPADVPIWVWALLGSAAVLGVAFIILHILSEAALIRGVADGQQGEKTTIREGLRRSRPHFWTLVGQKVVLGLIAVVSVAIIAAPVAVAHTTALPMWLGGTLTGLLVLVGIPWLLTLYFIYEYAMRFAVLEGYRLRESIRQARRFLHGRIVTSIKLTVLSFVGQMGGGLAAVLVAVPAALVGGAVYFAAGTVPALIVGGVLAAPFVIAVIGATGTFRSSVWTLGFIDGHHRELSAA
ncbi:MAG: hypothetical protein ABI333_10260 [bacterium]